MKVSRQYAYPQFRRSPFTSDGTAKLLTTQAALEAAARTAYVPKQGDTISAIHTALADPQALASVFDFVGYNSQTWPYFDQDDVAGDPNACGTTSLAMILAHYGIIGTDLADAQAVDREIRAWGGFSAPDDLEKYAESKGLNSEGYNNSSFTDLRDHLSKGRTVMAMVDGGGSPHWVAVLSTHKDANGKDWVTIADPGNGQSRTISREEFEGMWARPNAGYGGFANDLFGYHNFLQVYSQDSLPPARDFDIAYAQAVADGISDIANGGVEIGQVFTDGKIGGLVSGPLGIVGGLISTLSGVPGGVGRIVEMGGDRVLDWAGTMWNKGGVGNKILGGLGYVGGGILKGVGWVVKNVGNVVAKVGQKVGSAVTWVGKKIGEGVNWLGKKIGEGAKKVWDGVKDAAKAVGNAVKSVGKTIAKGIKKFFSGW